MRQIPACAPVTDVRTVIVSKSVDDEGEFHYINYEEECKLKARSILIELIDRLDVKYAACAVVERWTRWDHDGVKSALMLQNAYP